MTFAAASLGIVAAAIAVPTLLILYFLKLRRRDMDVSSTLLWKKAIQDMQANAPFQRLRRNILLLLQLLMLAAAILALAQPERKTDATVGQRHVILIDRSASMQAVDGGGGGRDGKRSRLDEAKKEAIELVNSLREPGLLDLGDESAGDQAMVVAFGAQADVRQNFTSNKAELRRAIEGIEPTDGPGFVEEAFKLAKAYAPKSVVEGKGFVALGPPAVIHIFSDGRLPDAEKAKPDPDDQVVFHAQGEPSTENLAITGLRVERPFDDPGKLSLFVGVQSTFRTARTVNVQLAVDGQVVAVKAVDLDAARASESVKEEPAGGGDGPRAVSGLVPGLSGVVFGLERAEGGVASVRLVSDAPDALAVDDRAFVVIPPARRLSALLVSEGSYYLREALEGLNLTKLGIARPEIMQKMLDKGGEEVDPSIGPLSQYDVIVLDKWLPGTPTPDGKTTPTLPPGRVLALGVVPPPPAGLVDDGPGEVTQVVSFARDHPALRYAQLDEITIGKSRKAHVADDTAVKIVARDQDSPIMFEAADADTRALVVTFSPAESDWALKPGFVAFLASALPWLAHSAGEESGTELQPGQTLSQRLPTAGTGTAASAVTLTLPDDQRVALQPAQDGTVAFGPLVRSGVYTLEWTGQAVGGDVEVGGRIRRALAANLLDPGESEIGAAKELALASRVVAAKGGEQNVTRKLWPWFVLGALGVCMVEWFVYNRKVHI
jgi:hypothetical protein